MIFAGISVPGEIRIARTVNGRRGGILHCTRRASNDGGNGVASDQRVPAKRPTENGRLEANTSGATLVTPSSKVMTGRKRRGSNPHLQNLSYGQRRVPIRDFRTGPSVSPRWPARPDTASPLRYRARARRLTQQQEAQ